ncbi:MAG: phosphogluconate dehydrogenase (NAD(+)-dependent, decarboxylating) [Nitrososphaerales archaeon]
MSSQIGIIGLGRMGANIARRLSRGGHKVVTYNRSPEKAVDLAKEEENVTAVKSLDEMASSLSKPRTAWVMVPEGDATQKTLDDLVRIFENGDIIIDGGNSNYKDTIRRAEKVKNEGLNYVDVGTSGGIWGLKNGYSLMIGGDKEVVEPLRPIFETLAPGPQKGWGHVGPSGSGHFVKMVHNGIEYGMMEAFAEGFEVLRAKKDFKLDLHQVAEIWRFGSVVNSWLLDLTASALSKDKDLDQVKGWVGDSGEGRWTIAEAMDLDIPAPIITMSLLMRFISRRDDNFSAKILAAMRREFGGHQEKA